jgi:hypothetical protein
MSAKRNLRLAVIAIVIAAMVAIGLVLGFSH